MKPYLLLAFALLASFESAPCGALEQDSQEHLAGKPDAPAFTSHVLVAKIREGSFIDGTAAESDSLGKLGLSGLARLLPAAEAAEIWKDRNSFLDLTKASKDEHYVIGLKDRRGRIFHEVVTSTKIPEDTGNRLRQSLARQEEVLRRLDEADKQSGDERLKTLSKVVEMTGVAEFHTAYPELAAEISKSNAPFLADIRSKLSATAFGQERTQIVNRLHFDLSMILRNVPVGSPIEKHIEAVDKFIVDRKLEPEMRQIITMRKYLIWSGRGRYKEALAALDEAMKIDPSSELAGRIPRFQAAMRTKIEGAKNGENLSPDGDSKGLKKPGPSQTPPGSPDQNGK